MKTTTKRILLASMAIALCAAANAQTSPAKALGETLRVEHYVEPVFPSQLRNKSVTEGYAQVQVLVAADGQIQDVFVSEYSRPEFAESAEAAVRRWIFSPDSNPAALPQRFNLRINFRREGMIVVQGDFHETVSAFLKVAESDGSVTICKLRDLDATPEIVNLVVPTYPEALKQQKIEGAAAVSFYIDEQGRVRTPSIAGSTRPEFAMAALDAVRQWTFSPPLRKGELTRVFAVQEFNFNPDMGPDEKPAKN